ncbi:hypothetical protein HOO68_03510 [Candidatus Gracilibacteria bacterium]|nr:hypothetical protein [Candidatus Gracilibacteria bacterium]
MKKIQIYIFLTISFSIISIGNVSASSDKGQERAGEVTPVHTTQHPPHDHHEPDHIKKLDEGMRRRRTDEKESD